MRIQTPDGVTLHVQVLGAGPPIVMLHGLLVGNMATWYWTAAPQLAKTHRVIMFDLRGHGLSERATTGYDVATMAEDLEHVIDVVAEGPAMVVGHSYGGAVALSLALRAPEKVTRLAIVDAPLPPGHLAEVNGTLARPPEEILLSLPEKLQAAVAGGSRQGRKFFESVRFLTGETSFLADLSSAVDIPDEAIATLRMPTVAIYGTQSSCFPVGQRLRDASPNVTLRTLDAGHFLPLEVPNDLTSLLVEFARG